MERASSRSGPLLFWSKSLGGALPAGFLPVLAEADLAAVLEDLDLDLLGFVEETALASASFA